MKSLSLKNIATISDTTLELGPGLNVLTGETGSGKSILIEGLLLALGERADKSLVRTGARLASVEAVFSAPDDEEIFVRREIHQAGRSRMFLNDELVTLEEAREIVSGLVDLHTQRSTPALLSRRTQQENLDRYGGCAGLSSGLRELFTDYGALLRRQAELTGLLEESMGERELHRHEMDLIDSLDPSLGDYSSLREERKTLENLEREAETFSNIHENLEGDSGVTERLQTLLSESGKLDEDSGELRELLSQANISLREAAGICSKKLAGIESAPWRLEEIDRRLDCYSRLLSRCGGNIDALLGRREFLTGELSRFGEDEKELIELGLTIPSIREEIRELAAQLTEARATAAGNLESTVTEELRLLGIPHAVFEVSMGEPPADRTLSAAGMKICSDGAEIPEFLFAANPGQDPARLSTVASGGEISRVSLALRLALSSSADISTIVFDEIDTGIGGETTHALADSLCRAAASGRQVVVITHLAIVASRASTHLAVTKSTVTGMPVTEVVPISGKEQIEELTRILGGGDAAREHAQFLLSRAKKN